MEQALSPRLIWIMAVLVPTTLDAQVVPVYTDPTDVCITCTVSGIYQAEPSVFVSPVDPKRILVTTNTWRAPDYGLDFPIVQPWVTPCVTADGGVTWQCQTTGIPSGTTQKVADPASVITGAGRNYCSPFYEDVDGNVDQGCAVSTNNGTPGSWSNAAFPYEAPQNELGVDKGHLWVDGLDRMYAAWTHEGDDRRIRLRYADDAATLEWKPTASPITISDVAGREEGSEDRGVNIQAGPGNKVYATWIRRPPGLPTPPGNALGFARSINQGQSWPTKTYISQVIDGGVTKTLNVRELTGLGTGKTMPVQSYPSMAVNSDTVYIVRTKRGNPVGAAGDPEIYLIRSPDTGSTWYGPFRVNQDAGTADQWFPWVTWDAASRSLVVAFYDSRNVSNGAELYIAVSRNYGSTGSWTETRISDGASGGAPSFTADASGTGNDYLGVHARDGLAYPVWADDRDRTAGQAEPPADNGRPWKLYSSPLFVGGILPSTVSDSGQRYCVTGIPRFKLTVSWQTLVIGDKVRLEVYPPGATCEGTPTYVKEVASTTTSPSIFLEMHCVVGTWKYVIKSLKGPGLSKIACTEFYVSSCPTCDEVD